MTFQIDFKSGKPVYLQLVDQVRYAAASGGLKTGEPLPSIRPLAEQLRLNRNTVAKAYTELESLGVIETVPGKGCFLKENTSPFTQKARHKIVVARIDEALITAHQLQIDAETLSRLVQERIQFFERKNGQAAAPKPETSTQDEIWTPKPPSSTSIPSIGDSESWTPLTD
ncbi:MAG: GntR family transcriptional regulator [Limisphaerales bacterium]